MGARPPSRGVYKCNPSAEENQECVATVSRYAMEGWAITADPFHSDRVAGRSDG